MSKPLSLDMVGLSRPMSSHVSYGFPTTTARRTTATRRSFVIGYISGIFTAIMIAVMVIVPAGATVFAISEANEWESINMMREQVIPAHSKNVER